MFATPGEIAAKVAAGVLLALILAVCARLPFPRVCEYQPRFGASFFAFAVGCIAVVVWNELVTSVRDLYLDENTGLTLVWAAAFRWLGSIALIIVSVACLVRDKKGKPVGLASAAVVSLLTMVMTAPIGLIVFATSAILFMPRPPQ